MGLSVAGDTLTSSGALFSKSHLGCDTGLSPSVDLPRYVLAGDYLEERLRGVFPVGLSLLVWNRRWRVRGAVRTRFPLLFC